MAVRRLITLWLPFKQRRVLAKSWRAMKSFLCVASFSLINERLQLMAEKTFGRTLYFLKKSVFFLSVNVSAALIKRRAEGAPVDEDL